MNAPIKILDKLLILGQLLLALNLLCVINFTTDRTYRFVLDIDSEISDSPAKRTEPIRGHPLNILTFPNRPSELWFFLFLCFTIFIAIVFILRSGFRIILFLFFDNATACR